MKEDYKAIAKDLGVRHLFGKYGINILPRDPHGNVYKPFQIVRLDGWTFDPHEITQALLDDPNFDVKLRQDK